MKKNTSPAPTELPSFSPRLSAAGIEPLLQRAIQTTVARMQGRQAKIDLQGTQPPLPRRLHRGMEAGE